MEQRIRSLLSQVPELAGQQLKIDEIGEGIGLTNRNFRVTTAHGSYVVRIPGADTNLLGIKRAQEALCSMAAAAGGVGPAVLAYLAHHQVLICAFVEGRLLKAEDVRNPETLRRVARTLRRCHDHPPPRELEPFSAFTTVRAYHALASERGAAQPVQLGAALNTLHQIERELACDEPPCLCHNDLLASNFIDDGQDLRIIDWEYGGLGDRFFDLGNFAINHELSDAEKYTLLTAYFEETRPEHLRRLRLMQLASDLREATWSFLQAKISRLNEPAFYLARGHKHLERFLAGAGGIV